MANQYSLLLKAGIDPNSDSEIMQRIQQIQEKAQTQALIKIKVQPILTGDNAGSEIKTITAQYTDQLGKTVIETNKYREAQDGTITTLGQVSTYTDKANLSTYDFGAQLKRVAQTTIESLLTYKLLYEAIAQLGEGIQYIKDLNKEMTNIQLVTNQSESEVNKLAQSYNILAKEMGVTTLQVSSGSLEFIRQGKTAEETATLIKNSTMMAKLGNMEAAQSSEALTSIMNGFKMTASETTDVVSKLVSVDNIAATSVNELATAMQYSSSSAQQVGVDFDHLTAFIGTASAITRISSESIGQSMKTIFSRMTAIKDMKAFDAEGEDINKVEKALKGVNVDLRDSNGHFRDMQDVLMELSGRWNTFSKENQTFIAQQIGGVRQQNIVLALLSNQAEIQKQLTAETNSGGLATQRYAIYLQSVEAAQNKMTASWEQMWSVSLNSDSIKIVYDITSSVLDLISAFGGVPTIVMLAAEALIYFQRANIIAGISALGPIIMEAVASFQMLYATLAGQVIPEMLVLDDVMDANPIGLVALAVGALTLAFGYFSQASNRAMEDAKKFSSEMESLRSNLATLNKQSVSLIDLGKSFDSLKNNAARNNEEQKKFLDVQNQIKEILPEVNGYYDDQGQFIIDTSVDLQKLIDLKNEEIRIEKEKLQMKAEESINAQIEAYKKQAEELTRNINLLQEQKDTQNALGTGRWQSNKDSNAEVDKAIKSAKLATDEMVLEIKQSFMNLSSDQQALIFAKLPDDIRNALGSVKGEVRGFDDWWKDDAKKTGAAIATAYTSDSFTTALKGIGESVSLTEDMITKSIGGILQYGDIQKLVETNKDYLEFITVEDGQIKINTEGMRQYDIAKANDALLTAQQALATDKNNKSLQEEVAMLQAYKDSLVDGSAYLATYQKAQEDAQKAAEKAAEEAKKTIQEQIDAAKKLLDLTISMIKQQKEAEKQALQDQLDAYKKEKQAEIDIIHKQKDAEKQALQDQLNGYKKLIQARIDALDAKKAEQDYQKSVKKQGASIADLQSQIDILALDSSAEAKAKRLELEKQLADQKSQLEDDQIQHSVDSQKAALEEEQKRFEEDIAKKIKAIEDYLKIADDTNKQETDNYEAGLQQRIKDIDNYLSSSGTLMKDAIDLITNHGDETLAKLIEWNSTYGTGIQTDIIDAWNKGASAATQYEQLIIKLNAIKPAIVPDYAGMFDKATDAIKKATDAYKDFIKTMLDNPALGGTPPNPNIPSSGAPFRHSGIDTGFVKGLKSNEEFATLMAGELVINADQMNKFMNRTLPQIASSSTTNNGGLTVGSLITITGNADKSILPDLEKAGNEILKKINDAMKVRGNIRNTSLTSV